MVSAVLARQMILVAPCIAHLGDRAASLQKNGWIPESLILCRISEFEAVSMAGKRHGYYKTKTIYSM
jgi:hypothetical protein